MSYLVKARLLDLAKHSATSNCLGHPTSRHFGVVFLTMTPPCHSFSASQLPEKIQVDAQGKKRKTVGGNNIDLHACELLSLVQYNCKVEHPEQRDSPVLCYPVQRWFRR